MSPNYFVCFNSLVKLFYLSFIFSFIHSFILSFVQLFIDEFVHSLATFIQGTEFIHCVNILLLIHRFVCPRSLLSCKDVRNCPRLYLCMCVCVCIEFLGSKNSYNKIMTIHVVTTKWNSLIKWKQTYFIRRIHWLLNCFIISY